jgi:Cyclic nucleotide-binding domain
VRIESSVTAISWIPSEAVEGLPKLPFTMGVVHYDDPPPDVIEDLDALRDADAFREANELRGFVEFGEDGQVSDCGYLGRGHIGVTRIKLGPREVSVAAVALPTIQASPELGDGWVRFKQTAGGRTGMPAPRRVRGKPFFRLNSAIAWTTLALTIKADGTSQHELAGASPFPRHWIYDQDGKLALKSGVIDFDEWYRESHGKNTPWGDEDSSAFVTACESALERELSLSIMRSGAPSKPIRLDVDGTLTEQGEPGNELYLLLDGVLAVEVDGETVAEIGPGAILGERAVVEGGKRTATLRAVTPAKVVSVSADQVEPSALEELAGTRREEGH